jgi:hypothetical protein
MRHDSVEMKVATCREAHLGHPFGDPNGMTTMSDHDGLRDVDAVDNGLCVVSAENSLNLRR